MTLEQQLVWLLPIAIWEMIWKGIALWKAAHKDRTGWFIALLILNTAGILPIIYIFLVDKYSRERGKT